MQFIIDPSVLGGGGLYQPSVSSPATAPGLLETPEQKRKKQLLLQSLSGQQPKREKDPAFHNVFGTGPGAVTEITKKPDGTETKKFATPKTEPIPASEVIKMASGDILGEGINRMAQKTDVFDQKLRGDINLPTEISPYQPQLSGEVSYSAQPKKSIGSILSDPGVFGALGQIGAAIGGPGSFAERLGGFATNQARNQLFDRYLQQRLAGQGGAGSSAPFSVSGLGVGLLSPQEQLAATNQPLTELGALSDAAYKEALISGVETPEQLLNRQALITLLGKEPGRPNAGSFQNIEVGPDGKRTPGITHKWLIDDVTGEPIKYQGVVGATNPVSSSERADQSGAWYQKAVNEAKLNVDREASQYGKIQTDAFGNVTGIEWSDEDAPRRYQQSYYKHLVKAIKRFQALGNLPADFSIPFEQEVEGLQQQAKPKSSLLK